MAPHYFKQPDGWNQIDTLVEDTNAGDAGTVIGKFGGPSAIALTSPKFYAVKANDRLNLP